MSVQTGKKGGALRVPQLSDPSPACPRGSPKGGLAFTRPSMVFFQWEPRTVLTAAAITCSLGNFPASSYFVNSCLTLRGGD